MRIVSLIPSATEAIWALGLGHRLVGRTHECDWPPEVRQVPAVTRDLLPDGLSPAEIDQAASRSVSETHTIYELDREAFADARPDVVLTQRTCAVCAVDAAEVDDAVCELGLGTEVIAWDPHRLDEVIDGLADLGARLDAPAAGLALQSHLRKRLDALARELESAARPRVVIIEWPAPLYVSGHWVPDMVRAAGGEEVAGSPGEPSRVIDAADLDGEDIDIVLLSFCGYDLAETERHARPLLDDPSFAHVWEHSTVIAMDGSAYTSRPGPRVVDGVELLAWAMHRPHPDLVPVAGRIARLDNEGFRDLARV